MVFPALRDDGRRDDLAAGMDAPRPLLRLVAGTDVVEPAPHAQHRRGPPARRVRRPAPSPTPVGVDYTRLFDAAPHAYLVLSRDLIILDVNAAYLAATMTTRAALVGRPVFEAFPDNLADPAADGVKQLSTSFQHVLESGTPHAMAVQRYPVRALDGTFEERWWKPLNTPVIGQGGDLAFILHHVEDVTGAVRTQPAERELPPLATTIRDHMK